MERLTMPTRASSIPAFMTRWPKIAKQFGADIPTVRGDGGPYWEDGIGSDAFYAAWNGQNESRGPSAEKLATISTLVNPRLAVDHEALSQMWDNMVLMDEHTWTFLE